MDNKKIKYIISFIKIYLGVDFSKNEEIDLIYSDRYIKSNKKRQLFIYNSNKDFSANKKIKNKLSVEHLNLKNYEEIDENLFIESKIPVFFNCNKKIEFIENNNFKIVKVNFDIFSIIFFMLTRYEEFIADEKQLDEHERFPAKESLAYKNNFLERPIVDEYLELLRQLINWLGLECEWENFWGNNEFATLLTHDIDQVQKYRSFKNVIRPIAKNIIKNKSIKGSYNVVKEYIKSQNDYKKDPFWTFDYIIESENEYNFNSSFYFMTSNNKNNYDCNYDITSDKIQKLFKQINENNNEIGIHPNYFTYNNENKFTEQVKILKDNIQNKNFGGRQHYLRFDIKKTLDLYNKNDLLYDSTLSFADSAGFRCGTSHPFPIYSLSQNKVLNLWEIPLVVMEGSLKGDRYMNLEPDEALKHIKLLIDSVNKYHGVFTLLWHNSSLTDDWNGWIKVYEETLEYLHKKNAIGLNGREIISLLNEKGVLSYES